MFLNRDFIFLNKSLGNATVRNTYLEATITNRVIVFVPISVIAGLLIVSILHFLQLNFLFIIYYSCSGVVLLHSLKKDTFIRKIIDS